MNEHRLSNKLLAWSGVLEWQEVSLTGSRGLGQWRVWMAWALAESPLPPAEA